MNTKQVLVLTILRNHPEGLIREQIIEHSNGELNTASLRFVIPPIEKQGLIWKQHARDKRNRLQVFYRVTREGEAHIPGVQT
jgi:DNA-binding MarR family transcriptional regulator